jgi:glycerol-3-phosphate dehydrogenase
MHVDRTGLLTITGGKWTTYRHMAEDCVDHAITLGRLADKSCITKDLRIHGYMENSSELGSLEVYGSDAEAIRALADSSPMLAQQMHPELPVIAAEIVWGAREEMACTVEDALARRTRALFLNAKAAEAMAPECARLLARELGRDEVWIAEQVETFRALAEQYQVV